ncbi:MAG: hypothetical protein JST43_01395 [Bacteroidetes bacterium]|nr:hypothetical protein [Bacteroidota bacterium]MBS1540587.1 hypothetical protein [Bacteroidota bacterium]
MSKKIFFFFCLLAQAAWSQSGDYFLTHFAPPDERISNLTFGMVQDTKGILYFANKSGVLEFDGRNWNLINTQGPVYTVASWQNELFVGGFFGFGKLISDAGNSKSYVSLSKDQPAAAQVFSSITNNGKIYFANSHSIFVLLPASGKVESVIQSQDELSGLLEIIGNIYVKTDRGLLKIQDGKLVAPTFPWIDNLSIDFSSSFQNYTLLSVSGGRFFLASPTGLVEIKVAAQDYLNQNGAVNAAWLSEELVAIGTLRGGVVFINPQTGETKEITNFYTGLPDNEVYAVMADHSQGLWVAHDYGFTRIAPFLPFRSYTHYTGLEGNLLCAKTFEGQTYVGTTLGLFVLTKQEITEEVLSDEAGPSVKDEKVRKGIFPFLKKKNKVSKTEIAPTIKQAVKSTNYVYKKISGIEGKVFRLLETDGQLLAGGNFGVASVAGTKVSIITHDPVRAIFKSASISQLLAGTQDDKIKSFKLEGSNWKETKLLDTLNEYVSYIFEDKLENIWLCGRTKTVKIETVDGQITDIENVAFSNPTIDESVGLAYGSEVYMAAGGSFHRYVLKENRFEKYDSLPGTKKYFASAGYFWYFDGHRWRTVDQRMQASLKLEWLSLFSNIRFISPADRDNLWVITSNNELYKFSPTTITKELRTYPLFLKEVRGQQNRFLPNRSIKVSQLESTVAFEFMQPGYLGAKAVEYRYRVKGLSSDWTNWSASNNIVNFSYLPSGKYKVNVQTRDLMGKITNTEEIVLEVEPPYWKQPWFYLLEVILFGGMVFLSIRLSSGNPKYRLISQLLSLLTIVMIIQFVQAAANTSFSVKDSPVLDFFLQVAIALLILPAENFLRKKLMLREANR